MLLWKVMTHYVCMQFVLLETEIATCPTHQQTVVGDRFTTMSEGRDFSLFLSLVYPQYQGQAVARSWYTWGQLVN